jgi:rRNA processing protein Krr1/Pno1
MRTTPTAPAPSPMQRQGRSDPCLCVCVCARAAAVASLEPAVTVDLLVPGQAAGSIIGKGGETIRRLELDSGCRIQVAPRTAACAYPAVTVSLSLSLRVCEHGAGEAYGAGARCTAGPHEHPDAERRVTVSGPPANVDRARTLIEDLIDRKAGLIGIPGIGRAPGSGATTLGVSVQAQAALQPRRTSCGLGACVPMSLDVCVNLSLSLSVSLCAACGGGGRLTRRCTMCRHTALARSLARAAPRCAQRLQQGPLRSFPTPPHALGRRMCVCACLWVRGRCANWSGGRARRCTCLGRARVRDAPSPLWVTWPPARAPRC